MIKSILRIYVFLTITFVVACSNSNSEVEIKENVPNYVLSSEKMSDVLVDLHIIDAAINLGYINQSTLIYNKSKLQDSVFSHYKIKRAGFDSSVVWYAKHLQDLRIIYDDVTTKLNKKHAETQR